MHLDFYMQIPSIVFFFKLSSDKKFIRYCYMNSLVQTAVSPVLTSCSDMDGIVQERRNSIANALELHLSSTNPSICIARGLTLGFHNGDFVRHVAVVLVEVIQGFLVKFAVNQHVILVKQHLTVLIVEWLHSLERRRGILLAYTRVKS